MKQCSNRTSCPCCCEATCTSQILSRSGPFQDTTAIHVQGSCAGIHFPGVANALAVRPLRGILKKRGFRDSVPLRSSNGDATEMLRKLEFS